MCNSTRYLIKVTKWNSSDGDVRHDDQLERPDAKLAAAVANCKSRPSVRPVPPATSTSCGASHDLHIHWRQSFHLTSWPIANQRATTRNKATKRREEAKNYTRNFLICTICPRCLWGMRTIRWKWENQHIRMICQYKMPPMAWTVYVDEGKKLKYLQRTGFIQ